MKKVFFFTAALCMIATVAFADTDGRLGIGAEYNRDVSIFYGLSQGNILKGGLSLAFEDEGDETATTIVLGAGFEKPLVYGENAQFNLDFGVEFASFDGFSSGGAFGLSQDDDNTTTVVSPHIGFTVRAWMGNHFSLSATHGVKLDLISPPGDGDSLTNFGTFHGDFTDVAFTFWFDPK
jgi:hypothetical protein